MSSSDYSSSESDSSESDSEGFNISFKGGQIEINAPSYKSAENITTANESARINSLIQENLQICEDIFNSLTAIKIIFFCIRRTSTDYIMKLKKLDCIPIQPNENYKKLNDNIKEILDIFKYQNTTLAELTVLELGIISYSLSDGYYQKLRLYLRKKTIEDYCSIVRLFCKKTIIDHEEKVKNFLVVREFIEHVCARLANSVTKIDKTSGHETN